MNWTNTPAGPISAKASAISFVAPRRRLVEQRQAGDDGGDRLAREGASVRGQVVGVALDDRGRREALLQHAAEAGIVFDQHEPLGRDAGLDQRPRDRAGAGPELDDEPVRRRADRRRHRARERSPRRRDRAGQPRRGDERS